MTTSCIAALLALSVGISGDGSAPKDGGAAKSAAAADRALTPSQENLLDLAFKAASSLPDNPHVKNRCRMQGEVVTSCLTLDQPKRALRYVEKISNWRRGLGFGEYAFYFAKHGGDPAEVERCLALANDVAVSHRGDDAQDWERDRILGTIAATRFVLGQKERSGEVAKGLESDEAARIEPHKAALGDASACDAQLDEMERLVSVGTFEQIHFGLKSLAQFYDRFYGDAERRAKIEQKIVASWAKMPLQIQIELLEELAGSALGHSDPPAAADLVKQARTMVECSQWKPEDVIPITAKLAGLRYRAGEKEAAKAEADAALKLFDSERSKITDIYRARVLRSLAEAYQTMDDTGDALRCYIRAVDAGVENPNSRPRADDLQATCTSMAIHGVSPDGELWERLTAICDKLGPPW